MLLCSKPLVKGVENEKWLYRSKCQVLNLKKHIFQDLLKCFNYTSFSIICSCTKYWSTIYINTLYCPRSVLPVSSDCRCMIKLVCPSQAPQYHVTASTAPVLLWHLVVKLYTSERPRIIVHFISFRASRIDETLNVEIISM